MLGKTRLLKDRFLFLRKLNKKDFYAQFDPDYYPPWVRPGTMEYYIWNGDYAHFFFPTNDPILKILNDKKKIELTNMLRLMRKKNGP